MNHLGTLESKLGYVFNDKSILIRACTHRSANADNNQRLEFLGDSIIGTTISLYLYDAHPKATDGEMSRAKASLVSKRPMAKLCRHYGFEEHLIMGHGERKAGGYRRESIQEDLVEALIGAVFEDTKYDMEATRKLIITLFQPLIKDMSMNMLTNKDSKTLLQEKLQGLHESTPTYTVKSVVGETHNAVFTVACECSLGSSEGTGRSRKIAEQEAAKNILLQMVG